MTSRMESSPASSMHTRSRPSAKPPIGGRAELERVHQEAELLAGALDREAHELEHVELHLRVVDTHAAAARLAAVHDEVVGGRCPWRAGPLDLLDVELGRQREGLVLGLVALGLVVPVEQREVHDPEEVVALARHVKGVCHVKAHAAQDLVGALAVGHGKHHEVAQLDAPSPRAAPSSPRQRRT